MTINLAEHLTEVRGGAKYLPVAPRVVAFREQHPTWAIVTEVLDGEPRLVKAYIQDEGGNVVATAHKTIVKFSGGDVEKAETGAVGRALSLIGIGTLSAMDLDEGEQIAEAPVETPPADTDADGRPSWGDVLRGIDDPDALLAELSDLGRISNPHRRAAALRIWADRLTQIGGPEHLKAGGTALSRWQRMAVVDEVLTQLRGAYRDLTATAEA